MVVSECGHLGMCEECIGDSRLWDNDVKECPSCGDLIHRGELQKTSIPNDSPEESTENFEVRFSLSFH